ncbi:hypothetical protein GGE67_000813 [Rhizobium leucaenae]|uniref:Uncharacterized protein n=1 Tax=Rhizobium leucaenae TaxID=29450 RepID=A0A7W6ZTT9_9HYPH|nr:hypothetical protein [Rhizobium leucaenae]MBB6300210.1 hypothetical protein [Rhizobium leucaenae]
MPILDFHVEFDCAAEIEAAHDEPLSVRALKIFM